MSNSIHEKEISNYQNNISNKHINVEEIIKKRKDPKTMTVEELEEYISKNRSKFKEGGVSSLINNNLNKSLNSSGNCQKVLNRSYNAGNNNISNNLTNNNLFMKNQSNENLNNLISHNSCQLVVDENLSLRNQDLGTIRNNINLENSQKILNEMESFQYKTNNVEKIYKNPVDYSNKIKYSSSNNNHNNNSPNNSMNPFLNNLPSSKQNFYQNLYNNSNVSMNEQASDGEEKVFKFNNSNPTGVNTNNNFNNQNHIISSNNDSNIIHNANQSYSHATNNNINNTSSHNHEYPNSNAANNYLKSLQEKNLSLIKENEELKKNFIEVNEILEKERNEFQKKIINEINKGKEVEKSLKQELQILDKENKELNNESKELKQKLDLLNSNFSILENEKGRHLELNSLEKEKLNYQIEKHLKEFQEYKIKLEKLENENKILKESIIKKNEEVVSTEKNYSILKEENHMIKSDFRDKLNLFNKEIENINFRFGSEREELIENIKALKNIIKQLDSEKNNLMKKYEKNIKELTVKINRLERNNTNNSEVKLHHALSPKTKNLLASQSKSKEKKTKFTSNNIITSIAKERKSTKENELKTSNTNNSSNISNIKINKNKLGKNFKSPGQKKLTKSQVYNTNSNPNANTSDNSQLHNLYATNNSSRAEKSSRKSSKSNPKSKSSSKVSKKSAIKISSEKNSNNISEKDVNLKFSEMSLLSGFGTSNHGFLSPVQTNSSLENISTINTNLLNQFSNKFNNSPAINIYDNSDINKIYSIQNSREEIDRNNYLNVINNSIFELERNIADMNRNYKNMMIKLNTTISQEESSNLKRNINTIANNLQEQSERLMELKTRQQEFLKTSLKNNRF